MGHARRCAVLIRLKKFSKAASALVCPSSYDLGENLRAVLMWVTEGEDKPLNYPTMRLLIGSSKCKEARDSESSNSEREKRYVIPHVAAVQPVQEHKRLNQGLHRMP
jgi:hypothetical protein